MAQGFAQKQPKYKDYRTFLDKSLKQIRYANGNFQSIEKYILKNLDKLDNKFAKILGKWAEQKWEDMSRLKITSGEVHDIAVYIHNLSSLIIYELPINKRATIATNIEIAITGYKIAANFFYRHDFLKKWAKTQESLGFAYAQRISGNKLENLEVAINYYNAALKVYTREDFLKEWATIQIHLGNAYFYRIKERANSIEKAREHYNDALNAFTSEAFPKYRAAEVQINLGGLYRIRTRGNKEENLKQAISYLSDASEICHQDLPQLSGQWAKVRLHSKTSIIHYETR